jgi:5-methylthioadenosine/S-adenosylhomocysteine deaminase
MFEETRLASFLAKTATNDPTKLPAREALALATIGGARAMHMGDVTGSLEPGKRADLAIVRMDGVHNQPHFAHNPEAVYSRLVYAAKSTDVVHVVCNGRFLLRAGELLTVDEKTAVADAAQVAARIDAFVQQREASPYNKLVLLSGMERQKSFEVQIKVAIADGQSIHDLLNGNDFVISKSSHYRQYDYYFLFDGNDPDAARLRYREDDYVDESGKAYQSRSRLTLIGKGERVEFPNAVTLSRSRYLAAADRSLRFYREYFAPAHELEIHKDRYRWRIVYQETDFAINLDKILQPELPGYYLEIKSRTWSRSDAERKAELISELLRTLGVIVEVAEKREYAEFVAQS